MPKRYFKKTYTKKRYTKRVSSLGRVFNTIPRTLFPPLPQQLTVALTFAQEAQFQTPSGQFNIQLFALHIPSLVAGQYPGHFATLMKIYSRAYCEKAKVDITMMGISNGDIAAVAAAVMPLIDADLIGANLNAQAMNLIRSVPNAKIGFMPGSNSFVPLKWTFWLDSSKAGSSMAMKSDSYYTTSNGQAPPDIVLPVIGNIPASPTVCLMIHNNTPDNTDWTSHRKVTYYIRFSNLHFGQVSNVN